MVSAIQNLFDFSTNLRPGVLVAICLTDFGNTASAVSITAIFGGRQQDLVRYAAGLESPVAAALVICDREGELQIA